VTRKPAWLLSANLKQRSADQAESAGKTEQVPAGTYLHHRTGTERVKMTYSEMRNYRMTSDEFRRFVAENDPLAELPGTVARVESTVALNKGHRTNLGYGGATLDADGFTWVRTSRPVGWM
jgi:hypothetical protein